MKRFIEWVFFAEIAVVQIYGLCHLIQVLFFSKRGR
jgi:hypothetical protein